MLRPLVLVPAFAMCEAPAPRVADTGTARTSSDSTPSSDSAGVHAAIEQQTELLEAAYLRGDARAIAAVYASDGVLRSVEGAAQDMVGRAAIEAGLERLFARSRPVDVDMESVSLDVHGDSAIQQGRFVFSYAAAEGSPNPTSGNSVIGWRRGVDGVWRIADDRAAYDEEL